MSAVTLIDSVKCLEIEQQRIVKTAAGKEIQTADLYETGKNSINSCVTEVQLEAALRYICIIEKIDELVAHALYYYYKVKKLELQDIDK